MKKSPVDIANQITTCLFQNVQGDVAERLVLWRDSEQRDLGGWSFDSVQRVILKALTSEESRLSESTKAINLLAQMAANLPDDWEIEISLSNDEACLNLYNPKGIECSDDASLGEDEIQDLIDFAKEVAGDE